MDLVDSKLNLSQQCVLADKRATCTLGCIKPSTASQVREETVLPCSELMMWPNFEN